MMSTIVGPDGQTPMQSEEAAPTKKFLAGGLSFKTQLVPEMLLDKALKGAKQMVGAQAYQAALERTKSHTIAQTEGQTAAATVGDPFLMEPCAMAVFMYLSREIEYRDLVIEQLNERLESLGAKPIDVAHPYPEPAPPPEEEPAPGFVLEDEAEEPAE